MTDELTRFRADVPPADPAAMMRARAALVREATGGHRARMWWQVGITGAVVTAMAVALFALPSAATRTPPASVPGLVYNPDGTITVDLRELDDVRGANVELREAGVRAVILTSPNVGGAKCASLYPTQPNTLTDVVLPRPTPSDELTFRPDQIPTNMWLYIQSRVDSPVGEQPRLPCDLAEQWYLSGDWLGVTPSADPNIPPDRGTPLLPTEQSPTGSVPDSTDVPTPSSAGPVQETPVDQPTSPTVVPVPSTGPTG